MSNATMITISGNLADAPELKLTHGGKATTRMRVAVDSGHRNQAGEWVDGTPSWYTVIAWDTLAENLAEQLGKGDRVIVKGRLEQRDWTTDAGETRTVWELTADDAGPSLRMPARGGAGSNWDNSQPARSAERAAPRTSPTQTPRRNADNRRSAGNKVTS